MLYYGGESNVPGAPGNLVAGSPGYFMPEGEIQRRMQERYYQTPAGQQLRENTNKLREKIQQGNFRPSLESASVYPGGQEVGNAAGIVNAQFFNGPQSDEIAMEPPYTPRERQEDQILLRSLQKGEMGSGPLIDKAIQDLIQRTSMGGTGLRGV